MHVDLRVPRWYACSNMNAMSNKVEPKPNTVERNEVDNGRRKFLLFLPIGIFAGIAGPLAAAAFRFLRPATAAQRECMWLDAMPMANIKGDKPMICAVTTTRVAGWSTTLEEQQVFILPAHDRKALSSACPHEGCNVIWREESNDFSCPCHDSSFGPDGTRLGGPAQRGLDPLPTREKDGMLQVQCQTFMNSTVERVPRA